MNRRIEFAALVEPQTQTRPKARRIGNMVTIYYPQSEKIKAYRKSITDAFAAAVGQDFAPPDADCRVVVSIDFVFKRPVYLLKKDAYLGIIPRLTSPDVDNLIKNVLDALTGHAWKDDNQVWLGRCAKFNSEVEFAGKSGRKMISTPGYTYVNLQYIEDDVHHLEDKSWHHLDSARHLIEQLTAKRTSNESMT